MVEPERGSAKLEHPSSAFAALRHLLPHGEKGPPGRGRRANRFTAAGNHHRARLTEALLSRLSFSPLWEKVAEPERSAGEVG